MAAAGDVTVEADSFDAAWPDGPEACEEFCRIVGGCLEQKGYCVVALRLDASQTADAAEAARGQPGLARAYADEAEDFLGSEADGHAVAWLQRDLGSAGGSGLRFHDLGTAAAVGATDALAECDRLLSVFGSLMWTVTPEFEDEALRFVAWGRTDALLRVVGGAPAAAEAKLASASSHADFEETRRLCILLPLDASGELSLRPYEGDDVSVPVGRGRLIAFRHDRMQYSFQPAVGGKEQALLQAWLVDLPSEMKEREEEMRQIDGPPEPLGRRVNVMSIQTRYPGNGSTKDAYWNMLLSGGDTEVVIPLARWDLDVYYMPEHTIGYSMTKHSALMTQDELELFDNKFFGIEYEEAMTMAPLQRIVMEVGYEAMSNAGFTRDDMRGWNCGVFIGDSGSDWDAMCPVPLKADHKGFDRIYGRSNAITACRLSHAVGLTGPVSTAETACSSSLVAAGVAHMAMRVAANGQRTPGVAMDLKYALVVGINTLVGPGSYIALSGPGMLTTRGRCFTFNDSADGFARGEGCGGILLKSCENSVEAVGRLAMLIGSCINQDGRSASMTAPHGPSQQDVIRASMREAGLTADMITIAECHGTGTALGDPIEVGALRGVIGEGRRRPILKTSSKTNIGHLEAAAGMAGLIKCVQMLRHCVGTPNCHLNALNPHLDVTGYPCQFETELIDFGSNSGLTGVSSFGFGGTNARADLWGNAQVGQRKCITGTVIKQRHVQL